MSAAPNASNLSNGAPPTTTRACRKCRSTKPKPLEVEDSGKGWFKYFCTCGECGNRQRVNFRRGELS